MYWVTFIISGFTVASIPWIAKHFSNQIAGLVLLIPVMFTLSIIVQYLANGEKATTEMVKASLIGYPSILIFLGLCIFLFQRHYHLAVVLGISLGAWLISALIVNYLLTK